MQMPRVEGLGPDLYLADVRQGAMTVFDSGFNVSTRSIDPVHVLIASDAGTVDGVFGSLLKRGSPEQLWR